MFKCTKCGHKIVESKINHVCPGMRKCYICKEIVGHNHQCFIQKYVCKHEETEETKSQIFIFYNFEFTQDSGKHQVNFCVDHRSCFKCMYLPVDAYCKTCSELPDKGKEMIF